MILTKLIVTGFKSFADKTAFEFDRGITCIVGPNGCGKSNVVDAVKWVVGEQSAKSLRGGQMLDMIFNGSSTRTASSMAQVDLVFDNSDGTLNVDHTEVTISRRLYRSGDSAYLINKEPCRLRDVKELLLDTGVGMNAYSVIEQGRVDQMLRANPQERRALFEEAAGISKYKARRKEAERKLDRTQDNLLRLQDLLDELEARLRRVRAQASKARRFQEFDTRLRELRASFALSEYHRLSARLTELARERAVTDGERTARDTELAAVEAASSELGVAALELDQQIESASSRQSELRAQASAFQERVAAATQREAEQTEAVAAAQARGMREAERTETLTAKLAELDLQLPDLDTALARHAQEVEQLTATERRMARDIQDLESRRDDEKSGLLDLLRRSAELHTAISGLDHRHENLREKQDRLRMRGDEIQSLLEDLVGRKTLAARRVGAIDDLLRREQEQLHDKQARSETVQVRSAAASEELATLKAERSGLQAELKVLQDLEARMEGVDQAVRDLLNRRQAQPDIVQLATIRGMVADLVTTDSEHAVVIEAALERWAQHLVVEDSATFLGLNGELTNLRGRLHVLCLDRLNPAAHVPDYRSTPGVVARARDLVRLPAELAPLADHLLGRTFVVESREVALALAEADTHGCEFITAQGERMGAAGELVLGTTQARTGLISRKSRLREIEKLLGQLDQRIIDQAATLNRQQAESAHLADILRKLQASIAQNHADRAQTQATLEHAQNDIDKLSTEQPRLVEEARTLEAQMIAAHEQAEARKASLVDLEARNTAQEQIIAEYATRIDALAGERATVAEALTEARVLAGKLAEKRAGLISEQQSIRGTLDSAARTRQELLEQIAGGEQRIAQARQTVAEATAHIETLESHLLTLDDDILAQRHRREQLRQQIEDATATARRVRAALSEIEQVRHTLDMKQQEAEVRREELVGRVREELGVDLTTAPPLTEEQQQDWAAVEEEIQTLRGKIEKLGHINLEALDELEELEQRLDFLNQQRTDLNDSRHQLEALIETLNNESRERFERVFNDIRAQFQVMFRKLFGGGKADLVLDATSEDILEAGIDVMARPPGKELQGISLMSGGEKTMTAIALLLSIFKSKPSPFVFLDEVDAALDEANNERFNHAVVEFLGESQFVIITHSKRTMHVADRLYGVTMQEPGCSRLVSVGFESNNGSAPSAAPTAEPNETAMV